MGEDKPGGRGDDRAVRSGPGPFRELLSMLVEHRKYWLIPALLVLLATAVLIALAASGAAPFIYTLF
jgi:hypothetical protein